MTDTTRKIRVVKIDCAARTLEEVEIPATLEAYYQLIDCTMIENSAINLEEYSKAKSYNEIYVDEEGLLNPKPGGFYLEGDLRPMMGSGMIVGVDLEEGLFVDYQVDLEKLLTVIRFISAEQVDEIQSRF